MITLFSNRIYKNDLTPETVEALTSAINEYNSIRSYALKALTDELRYSDSGDDRTLFLKVSSKYPEPYTYTVNSAIGAAKAAYKSCKELTKDNIATLKAKEESTLKKLKKEQEYLDKLYDAKKVCIAHSKSPEEKVSFDKTQRTFKMLPGNKVAVYKGNRHQMKYKFDTMTDFECQYLTPEIRKVKARIGWLKFKINKCQSAIDLYKGVGYDTKYIKSVQFGSRKLRKQGRTDAQKKQEYEHRRHKIFSVSGRCDSKDGNFVFSYNEKDKILKVKLKPRAQIFLNVSFPYGQEFVEQYYGKQRAAIASGKKGKPITYSIEDLGKYYIVKCSLETESEVVNYSTVDGVIGIDTNLGFFSVCETNASGQPILFKDYRYEWERRTGNQIKNNICIAVRDLIVYAETTHKPIVIEDLKFRNGIKLSDYTNSKNKNFRSNMFAYSKMIEVLTSAALRHRIEVYVVNPAYTSLIGRAKFMPYYKRSVHQMAALTIARRCLSLSEKVPTRFGTADWKTIYNKVKSKKHFTI